MANIDFVGISEPMLWHILWVVYSNGRDELLDQSSGLSPYMSTNYWKDKFSNQSRWKFVFIEKLSTFSQDEANGLLAFLYNMAVSCNDKQSKDFLVEIVTRIAEICLFEESNNCNPESPKHLIDSKNNSNQSLYSAKGIACLSNLLNKYRSLIPVLFQLIDQCEECDCQLEASLYLFQAFFL